MVTARVCGLLTGIGVFAVALVGGVRAEDSITVASWGGAYQEAESKAFFQPAAKALGITIKDDTTNGLADVRLQVTGNAVKWDIVLDQLRETLPHTSPELTSSSAFPAKVTKISHRRSPSWKRARLPTFTFFPTRSAVARPQQNSPTKFLNQLLTPALARFANWVK